MNPSIIYQDNDIVAVNKPAGISIHKGVAEKGETVADWLVEKFPEIKTVGDDPNLRPGIVHRLDKETSGVLVMAKNQKAFDFMKSRFQNREV
ncbi:MAG: pseudouridine synthase, partial [Patescibacteria group bacterium]